MIPVYIGITERFNCIKGMTERSILENTNSDVEITHLYPEVEAGCTGFTNVRYTIPYGIYLDVDMIVLGDIAELWSYRRKGKFVCLKDGSTEVSVIDCHHKVRVRKNQSQLPLEPIIPLEWNVEDFKYYDKPLPEMKLFHFTALNTQPWFHDHPSDEAKRLYERYI